MTPELGSLAARARSVVRLVDPRLELLVEVVRRSEHEAMEGELLRQWFASHESSVFDSIRQIEVDVETAASRTNAAEDPVRSAQDDQLWRYL